MKIRMTVAACALLSVCNIANAQVYKWVDARGKIQYGDRPPLYHPISKVAIPKAPRVPVRAPTKLAQPATPQRAAAATQPPQDAEPPEQAIGDCSGDCGASEGEGQ